jgi:uncharacterized protein YyaL (SSP411 family)
MRLMIRAALAIFLSTTLAAGSEDGPLHWEDWNEGLFARARAEQRFVILDLEAVWCHWCHVMAETTYQDPKVVGLLQAKYLTVRVDQDASPDLSSRYGDWGWPATIIFAPDGSEIVKRRGYIEPAAMAALLAAVIADPSPGPSVRAQREVVPAADALLGGTQRAELMGRSRDLYDARFGGWGEEHKFIDADSMDLLLSAAERGDKEAQVRARQTLDAALALIDRPWGGIFQYSDAVDWSSPHYEKIMFYQASALRQYAEAYALWKEPAYLKAAQDLKRFLLTKLQGPDGAFFTSQDADVDAELPGKEFYAYTALERAKLGREPRIDRNMYARENGWAISGLVAVYAATGDEEALRAALRAAEFILAHRSLAGGGFAHGEHDRGGPFLSDTLAMGAAALDLYAATGDRAWLGVADRAGEFIAARFKDEAGGFRTTLAPEAATGAFLKTSKPLDEQVAATRLANRLYRYLGKESYHALAEHGARYLGAAAEAGTSPWAAAGILLADQELTREPTHITIMGHKDAPEAVLLHKAGLAYPALYKRLDWWDKREGPLPNPDVRYPELDQPAAFACANKICSLPAFDEAALAENVSRMLSFERESAPGRQ